MPFQSGWQWCRQCQGLFYSRNATPGICPDGGRPHDGSRSGTYALYFTDRSGPATATPVNRSGPFLGQWGWRWCRKCQSLFYGGNPSQGDCPAGDRHDGSSSADYVADYIGRPERPPAPPTDRSGEPHQSGWRWCPKCQQLVFGGNAAASPCAGGGTHSPSGSDYVLNVAGPLHEVQSTTLLVIAPRAFETALAPLINHKNATDMPATVVTREALTAHYLGRDDPEKLKRGIAFAHQYLNTRFVFLVGDASLIPVRYRRTTIPAGGRNWRDAWYTAADLYYANLYEKHQDIRGEIVSSGGFASWDANGDNRFNEQYWRNDARTFNPDQVDGVADVGLGRLPAHTASEVATYVDKVIRYERAQALAPRVSMTVFIDKGYEIAPQLAQQLIRDSGPYADVPTWRPKTIGLNYGTTAPPPGVERGSASGTPVADAAARSLWLVYIGHGSPGRWGANEADQPLDSARVATYANTRNLPIVYVAGCDTGQFVNNPPQGRYRDAAGRPHWYWVEPYPERPNDLERVRRIYDLGDRQPGSAPVREWHARGSVTPMITAEVPHVYDFPDRSAQTFASAWLFGSGRGGAIAYFGEITTCQNNWPVDLGSHVVRAQVRGKRILGDIWVAGQHDYWREKSTSEDVIGAPRIYLSYMHLFGDPSLRIP